MPIGHLKAGLELQIIVLSGVGRGGGALDVDLAAGEGEGLGRILRIGVGAGDGLLVPLVLGQLLRLQDHIGQVVGELGNDNGPVGVIDVVPGVPIHQRGPHLGVGDPVGQDLMPGQVVVVDPDAVQVQGALAGTDADIHGLHLGEVIVRRVLDDPGGDAVDVHQQEPVLGPLLRHEG